VDTQMRQRSGMSPEQAEHSLVARSQLGVRRFA
jgi:hypothetical protein